MKQILEQWSGKFLTENGVEMNLDHLKLKDGDNFHVRLVSKNREIKDEHLLSAGRL